MKARMSGAGTIRIESETPTEHELLQDLGARGPYFLIWRVDKGVEFAPQISPHAEADVLKSQIVGVKHELEDARQALLSEGVRVGELQDEVAGLKRQVDEETKAKHRAIAERDASRLFADDEITERAAAEKERDNLKDQLGMDPSAEAARRFGLCVQDIETVVRSIGQTARECQVIFEDFREALDEAAKPRTPRQPAQRASHPRYRRPDCRVMQSTRRPAHRQVGRKKRRF